MDASITKLAYASQGMIFPNQTREQLREQIEINKALENIYYYNVINIAASVDPTVKMFHKIADWNCPDSPFGLCAYNYIEDPGLNECIYCGDPNERK